ncbi:LysE family translocator [Modicisalibacter radicis]|uniref:LysE family translocator n=1 Tax=Halomonas sp. EAR18 TaxID=2518972 RepID=UPI00109C2570|nr:LysE family translocator [Halomonas sp. EAR18]
MQALSVELVAVATITLLAVISPGPDFAFIVRTCLKRGRHAGCLAALGIGMGVSLHIAYTLLGFGLLLAHHAWLVEVIRYLGAMYLIWLGITAWWPKRHQPVSNTTEQPSEPEGGTWQPFWQGLLCNALNPKAMLFIVALFSQVVSSTTAFSIQLGYGVFIVLAHVCWFALLARLLATPVFQHQLRHLGYYLDKLVGGCLMALGIRMATSG